MLVRYLRLLAATAAIAAHAGWVSAQDARLDRGRYLVEGIAACGNCHAVRDEKGQVLASKGLSGGMLFDEPVFKVYVPNITPDPETGIGKWTDAQLVKAIREGVRPDGSIIGPPMPIGFLRGISDSDAAAIVAYLRAQAPVRHQVPKSVYKIPLPKSYGPPLGKVSAPPASDTVKYGGYLVAMGHCMDCHTPLEKGRLDMTRMGAGGRVFATPLGGSMSRNITPHESGLKGWSDAQIERAIRTGVAKDGTRLKPPMGFDWYNRINAADMRAVIAYLRSIKPVPSAGG